MENNTLEEIIGCLYEEFATINSQDQDLFNDAAEKYGVDPSMIACIWALHSRATESRRQSKNVSSRPYRVAPLTFLARFKELFSQLSSENIEHLATYVLPNIGDKAASVEEIQGELKKDIDWLVDETDDQDRNE